MHIECVSDEVENMSRGKKTSRRRNKEHQGRKRKESGAWSLELGRPTALPAVSLGKILISRLGIDKHFF